MKSRIGILGAACLVGAVLALAAENPSAPGFDQAGSDARAIEIADRVMGAMGGRDKWDRVQTIAWTIFGRDHVWNKWTGDYRLQADTTLVVMNVNTMAGRVWEKGREVADTARRDDILETAKSIWINDSYWLIMPYKLKDSGVTLKYGGEKATQDGRPADVLVLTFKNVGDTPDNKYEVWVDRDTGLVVQWSYYANAADPEPRFTRPWTDWTDYDGIMMSTGRGSERHAVTKISVSTSDNRAAFTGP